MIDEAAKRFSLVVVFWWWCLVVLRCAMMPSNRIRERERDYLCDVLDAHSTALFFVCKKNEETPLYEEDV